MLGRVLDRNIEEKVRKKKKPSSESAQDRGFHIHQSNNIVDIINGWLIVELLISRYSFKINAKRKRETQFNHEFMEHIWWLKGEFKLYQSKKHATILPFKLDMLILDMIWLHDTKK